MERNDNSDRFFTSKENSIITQLFYSQIINIYYCSYNYISYSFQKIMDIPLLLPDKNEIGIYKLFKDYFKEEYVYFNIKCLNCNKITTHKKEVKISKSPNILIITLKRIKFFLNNKNNIFVNFPEKLDINNFIDHEYNNNKPIYELYAIINHQGNLEFGHYYAYIKLECNKWYEFVDTLINEINNLDLSNIFYFI